MSSGIFHFIFSYLPHFINNFCHVYNYKTFDFIDDPFVQIWFLKQLGFYGHIEQSPNALKKKFPLWQMYSLRFRFYFSSGVGPLFPASNATPIKVKRRSKTIIFVRNFEINYPETLIKKLLSNDVRATGWLGNFQALAWWLASLHCAPQMCA